MVNSRLRPLPTLPHAGPVHGRFAGVSQAFVHSDGGFSGMMGLYGPREGKVLDVDSNSNLMCARTVLPTLQGVVEVGSTWFASRVFGVPSPSEAEPPTKAEWLRYWQTKSERLFTSIEDMLDELEVV